MRNAVRSCHRPLPVTDRSLACARSGLGTITTVTTTITGVRSVVFA